MTDYWPHLLPLLSWPRLLPKHDPLTVAVFVVQVAIVFLQFRGASRIFRERDYHPAYKVFKQTIGLICVMTATSTITGSTGSNSNRIVFWGIVLFVSGLEYRFIGRRNAAPVYLRAKTHDGIVDISDRKRANQVLSEAAAIIRHQRVEGKKYVDDWALEELLEAQGVPEASEWQADIRRQARERRERLAADNIYAAELDLWRREREEGKE